MFTLIPSKLSSHAKSPSSYTCGRSNDDAINDDDDDYNDSESEIDNK